MFITIPVEFPIGAYQEGVLLKAVDNGWEDIPTYFKGSEGDLTKLIGFTDLSYDESTGKIHDTASVRTLDIHCGKIFITLSDIMSLSATVCGEGSIAEDGIIDSFRIIYVSIGTP